MQWLSTARQLVIPFPPTPPAAPPAETRGFPPRGCRIRTAMPALPAGGNVNPTLELLGVAAMLAAFLAVAVFA